MCPIPDQPADPGLPLSGEALRAVEKAPAALRPWAALAAAKAYGRGVPAPLATLAAPAPSAPEAESSEPPEPFDRNNREQIIKDYVPLVKFVAHRIASRLPSHVELDDLINSGILGLMDAIEKFEPARNIKFKTYAELRIKGAILDGLRDLDWVPRSLRRKKKDIEGAYHMLEQQYGRAATDEEVAVHLGIPLEELHKNLDELKGVTLGTFVEVGEDGEGESLISFVPDPDAEDPHQIFQSSEIKEILRDAMDVLPKKEKFVVQLYYFDELTMKEIGTLLNITESRVSQLHTKAMLRLRGKLLEKHIEG
ncbi:RNA polymerase sigma factor [Geothrix limicola]|uniref:RNA polymerase sigma factor n=1 Tax=Geothrix limicola TaxID=2927978 RepID=A0ABQ5QH39_9BACT|nr:FliA/WhiG family RNA polymerase sigma factor [Geothrix limicola]GLH73846.1 RNA polymerase sigma factor [Geothrix limicola]